MTRSISAVDEMARDCLVGSTGFVGQALLRARSFGECYTSANIADLPSRRFATLVCAAAPATMWAANANPAADKNNLRVLASAIRQAEADRVVLISTIAVLADPAAGYTESSAAYATSKPYGRHRHELEIELAEHCKQLYIIRLPALFGPGLKKNFIFDLINPTPSYLRADAFDRLSASLPAQASAVLHAVYCFDSTMAMWALDRDALAHSGARAVFERALDQSDMTARNLTNGANRFQFYNIDRLAADIEWMVTADIPLLHACSEPLEADEVSRVLTGRKLENRNMPVYCEDMRSDHAARFGNAAPYLFGRDAVLGDLREFFEVACAA